MEPRICGIVEQHEANDRGGAIFGDLAGFVEGYVADGHFGDVEVRCEKVRVYLGLETGETVDSFVDVATEFAGVGILDDVERSGKRRF